MDWKRVAIIVARETGQNLLVSPLRLARILQQEDHEMFTYLRGDNPSEKKIILTMTQMKDMFLRSQRETFGCLKSALELEELAMVNEAFFKYF